MDHFVYIAAAGATEALVAQAGNTHNLSNASTVGFRADLMVAKSALGGGNSRAYAGMHSIGLDARQGVIRTTGGELDVVVNGPGWMAVQTTEGTEAYSRRGDLRVDPLGRLLDGAGRQILGNGGPIALPPFSSVSIGRDGTISVVPLGESPNTLAVVDRIKLVNPGDAFMAKGPSGAIQMTGDVPVVADAQVSLISGSLESSNVDTVGSMVRMIEYSRQFENHTKMMKVAESLDRASAELMKMT